MLGSILPVLIQCFSSCYSAFFWRLQCFSVMRGLARELIFLVLVVGSLCLFLVVTVFSWWLQCFLQLLLCFSVCYSDVALGTGADIVIVLVVGSLLLFPAVTVHFCLLQCFFWLLPWISSHSVFFWLLQCFPLCYSDAGLGTGADISSARRWISLAVTGCYSVFSGGYNVFFCLLQ